MRKLDVDLIPVTACVSFIFLLAACNDNEKQVPIEISSLEVPRSGMSEKVSRATSDKLKEQVAFAKKDLAERRGIEPNTVSVIGVRQINWSSGALGCPEPGMNYTQVLVPGLVIHLKVGDEIIAYHASREGNPFHCPRDRAEAPIYDQNSDLI